MSVALRPHFAFLRFTYVIPSPLAIFVGENTAEFGNFARAPVQTLYFTAKDWIHFTK